MLILFDFNRIKTRLTYILLSWHDSWFSNFPLLFLPPAFTILEGDTSPLHNVPARCKRRLIDSIIIETLTETTHQHNMGSDAGLYIAIFVVVKLVFWICICMYRCQRQQKLEEISRQLATIEQQNVRAQAQTQAQTAQAQVRDINK